MEIIAFLLSIFLVVLGFALGFTAGIRAYTAWIIHRAETIFSEQERDAFGGYLIKIFGGSKCKS